MSSTRTTRRSRSGCQVRTTTCCRAGGGAPVDASGRRRRRRTRAASRTRCPARGPAPPTARRAGAAGPAATGRCLRDGERRQRPDRAAAPSSDRCRAAEPERPEAADGHPVGQPVAAPGRAQGRGEPAPLAGRQPRAGAGRRVAPADGCQASRSQPRSRARARGWSTSSERGSRRLAEPHLADGLARATVEPRGLDGASAQVDQRPRRRRRRPTSRTVLAAWAQHDGHHARAGAAAGPARSRHGAPQRGTGHGAEGARRAPRRRRRPRARPRGAATAGARASAWASALTSSGVTKSRPFSQAHARAVAQQRGRAARAHAERQRRRLPGGPGDVDDVAGDLGRDGDVRAPPRRPAARSAAPATGRSPAAARSRGSNPAACRLQHLELVARAAAAAARP